MADMVLAARLPRRRPRARGRARGDRDVRGRPAGHRLRRPRRGRLRRPPARAPDHRPRAGDRDTPVEEIARLPRAPLRARRDRRRGGRLGRPRRDRRARRRARSAPTAPSRRAPPSLARAPTTPRSTLRFQRKDDRAVPRLPRRASGCRATTTAASPCACSTPSSAGCPRRGCSRRCARSAGSPTRSTRSPASSPTPARSASTSARGPTTSPRRWRSSAPSSTGCAASGVTEEELSGRARTSRRASCSALESAGARMNRLGASVLYGLPLLEIDEIDRRASTRSTLDDLRALASELWAPRARSRPPASARRGRVHATPSRRSARPRSRSRRDARRRRRRRGADGPGGLRRRRGRRRPGAGRARRPGARTWRSADVLRRRRRRRRLHPARPGAGERARVPRARACTS